MSKVQRVNFDDSPVNTSGDFSTERAKGASACRNSPTVLYRNRRGKYAPMPVPERRAGKEYKTFVADVCHMIGVPTS